MNFFEKISIMFAKYFEYYIIILKGGGFRGRAVHFASSIRLTRNVISRRCFTGAITVAGPLCAQQRGSSTNGLLLLRRLMVGTGDQKMTRDSHIESSWPASNGFGCDEARKALTHDVRLAIRGFATWLFQCEDILKYVPSTFRLRETRNSSRDEIGNVNFLRRRRTCRGQRLRPLNRLPNFYKITQNKGHYAVQGHSRLPILVPIESSYTTSY